MHATIRKNTRALVKKRAVTADLPTPLVDIFDKSYQLDEQYSHSNKHVGVDIQRGSVTDLVGGSRR